MVFSYGASLWRLGISRLDRAGEARLVGSTVAEGGSDRVHRLVDAAAGPLVGGRQFRRRADCADNYFSR